MNFTNLFSINLLAKTIIIEEVAQAKRSDGGVLKVEQPGGPLAMEEFDRIKRIEKHKFLQ